MELFFETLDQFWQGFQQGNLPDLGSWNYMFMAGFMMVQGRASAVMGGIAASAGYLNLGLIILIALSARVFVDVFWYHVGATGTIDRLGRRIAPLDRMANKVQGDILEKPQKLVLLAKLSNGLALPVVVAAGNAGVPLRRFLPASFAGEVLWTIPLLLFGYFATDALGGFGISISQMIMIVSIIFLIISILYFIKSNRVSK